MTPLELDQKVAETLFGWTNFITHKDGHRGQPQLMGEDPEYPISHATDYRPQILVPKFSSDGKAAFKIIEKLIHGGHSVEFNGAKVAISSGGEIKAEAQGERRLEALCRAVLGLVSGRIQGL